MNVGERIRAWWRGLRVASEVPPLPSPKASLREGWFEHMLAETRFLERYPEYAGVLARMEPVHTHSVPVMAVGLRRRDDPDGRLVLLVNQDYFDEHPEHRAGVLMHEIQHVVLGHLSRESLHRVSHPRVMELAMELAANEPVRDPLPPHGIRIEDFTEHGIGWGQDTMTRYTLLRDAVERGDLAFASQWLARNWDLHRPAQECAAGGTGIGDLVDARSDGATDENWSRTSWGLGGASTPRQLERMREAIARHLRGERGGDDDPQADRARRRVAKELERALLFTAEGPKLHWRRVLRAAFPPEREVFPDRLRPSRRFPERVGVVPGRRRRVPPPRLLVAVDTSGSMSGDALDRCAREIPALARYAKVLVAEADAAVHRISPPGAPRGSFLGGGDTDFGPLFDEARSRRALDGVVYFTDGRGVMPDIPPSVPVLWVLTHDGPFEPAWGTVVRLPE